MAQEATPTGTCQHLINNPMLGNTQDERIHQVVELGVTFLARVLLQWRCDADYDPNLIICFNAIVKESLKKLSDVNFSIDIQAGNVTMKK